MGIGLMNIFPRAVTEKIAWWQAQMWEMGKSRLRQNGKIQSRDYLSVSLVLVSILSVPIFFISALQIDWIFIC